MPNSSSANDYAVKLGAKIRDLREQKAISQTELAALTRFHRNWIGRVERGQVNLTVFCLIRIAEALETDASAILRQAGY